MFSNHIEWPRCVSTRPWVRELSGVIYNGLHTHGISEKWTSWWNCLTCTNILIFSVCSVVLPGNTGKSVCDVSWCVLLQEVMDIQLLEDLSDQRCLSSCTKWVHMAAVWSWWMNARWWDTSFRVPLVHEGQFCNRFSRLVEKSRCVVMFQDRVFLKLDREVYLKINGFDCADVKHVTGYKLKKSIMKDN